ncbi:group II intron reverse transcriptase/maturase [Paenibacillus tianmuensis]|uniref:RNA-directed DNA polymerase n=1 Tax=Paenibacillus tianmuensis TaxID=624147 RepID=A0A1G4QZA7_9BACL|nr:group II intron reverse transcriptase/maturase [Paenibacillus tianmuensis]
MSAQESAEAIVRKYGTPESGRANVNSRMNQNLSRSDVKNAEFRKKKKELLWESRGEAPRVPERAEHRPAKSEAHPAKGRSIEDGFDGTNHIAAESTVCPTSGGSNKGAAGIDGVRIEQLREYIKEHWGKIRQQLLEGTYKPTGIRRVEIPKPDGGVRLLGIPTVMDRLIQQAILQVLTPIFDPEFSESSYGFRPKRRGHDAVRQAQRYIRQGYRMVVDIDLLQFFDRVNHDILLSRIARKVKDKRALKLIRTYLKAGMMIGGVCISSEEGTPQGGPLSPLLGNILLDDVDKELERRGLRFCRYADDCNIYVKTKRAGERVKASVTRFFKQGFY